MRLHARLKTAAALLILALAAGGGAGGCGYLGSARDFDPAAIAREPGWIAARDVPLMRQEAEEDCGAAALAMMLAAWDGRTTLAEVTASCPPAPGRGSRAGDLRDLARARGFRAYLIRGGFDDLRRELDRGRPVLVGLVKPQAAGPRAHYEVVTAMHPARRIVVTLDPADGWRENGFDGFLREWDPSGRLTLVMFDSAVKSRNPYVGIIPPERRPKAQCCFFKEPNTQTDRVPDYPMGDLPRSPGLMVSILTLYQ
jgi:hypothetical protein